jgi:hypothetical protein
MKRLARLAKSISPRSSRGFQVHCSTKHQLTRCPRWVKSCKGSQRVNVVRSSPDTCRDSGHRSRSQKGDKRTHAAPQRDLVIGVAQGPESGITSVDGFIELRFPSVARLQRNFGAFTATSLIGESATFSAVEWPRLTSALMKVNSFQRAAVQSHARIQ